MNFKLGKIKAVASFLTSHTKKLPVNAFVMLYFHYCSPAWSSGAPCQLRKVDKKVVDASNFLGRKDNYSINTNNVKDVSLLVFKAFNNIEPNYTLKLYNMTRNSHSDNARRAAKIISNFLQPVKSLDWKHLPGAPKLWNNLPLRAY